MVFDDFENIGQWSPNIFILHNVISIMQTKILHGDDESVVYCQHKTFDTLKHFSFVNLLINSFSEHLQTNIFCLFRKIFFKFWICFKQEKIVLKFSGVDERFVDSTKDICEWNAFVKWIDRFQSVHFYNIKVTNEERLTVLTK